MRFRKPLGVKIVDMCKYVDDNADREDLNEIEKDTIFLYLYFIIYSISMKQNYFSFEKDCDDFSVYFAEKMYNRLTRKKSSEYFKEEKELPKVKSCLNYMKSIIQGRILEWQQKEKFSELLESYHENDDYTYGHFVDTYLMRQELREQIETHQRNDITSYVESELANLPKLIKNVCEHTQYKHNKLMVHNLYISCLLTFLSSITLDKNKIELIKQKQDEGKLKDGYIVKLMSNNDEIVLWHLSDDFRDYIKILFNRIKKQFISNIFEITNGFSISDDILDIMITGERGVQA